MMQMKIGTKMEGGTGEASCQAVLSFNASSSGPSKAIEEQANDCCTCNSRLHQVSSLVLISLKKSMLRQASVLSKRSSTLLLHTPSRGCSTRNNKKRHQRHPVGVRSLRPGAGGVAWLTADSAKLDTNLHSVIVLGGMHSHAV